MYYIKKNQDHLLVEFKDNFDCNAIRAIIHHVTMLKEYPHMDDIWLFGSHHADIRLGDIEILVNDFSCRCRRDMTRHKKTAFVAELGLTRSIIELWMGASKKRLPFDLQIFNTLEEAQDWLGIAKEKVA
ncbi:MAG: hypothetical protein KJN98_02075 [Pontiella sp.]|nr:hypothetical protein [Pontiella sp.]